MRILLLCALLALNSNTFSQVMPVFDVQGHRGARGLMPENTIPAFLLALDSGVTTLEMDVVITKDEQVVVSHEPWMSPEICLDSIGNPVPDGRAARLNIYQMTYAQVASCDCGSKGNERFPDQQKVKVAKPLLKDVLIAVEDHIRSYSNYEVDYNIEIKSTPDGDSEFHPDVSTFSDLVYNLVNQYIPLERLVIQSFDFRVLQYWHEKYPKIRLAALVQNMKGVEANLADLGFTPSIYSPEYRLLTNEAVKLLHTKNIKVIPWTVNEISSILALKGMGVDGVITDYPNRARQYKLTLNIPYRRQ